MLNRLPEWKREYLQTRAGRTKTEERASRKGKRGAGWGEKLAWRIKYRYDNRT